MEPKEVFEFFLGSDLDLNGQISFQEYSNWVMQEESVSGYTDFDPNNVHTIVSDKTAEQMDSTGTD